MPQLIAMVIVVVGAMIYMFQTFGGTGDKIEGVAQKASIITEINNIKDGVKIAAKSGHIGDGTDDPVDAVSNLAGLATLSYFAEQINEQVINNTNTNEYNAISFGGGEDEPGGMQMKLVVVQDKIPGIFVDLSVGTLDDNKAFLEAQIANDLSSIAHIDRAGTVDGTTGEPVAGTIAWQTTQTTIENRMPGQTKAAPTATDLSDGQFIIYFNDFGSDEVVK